MTVKRYRSLVETENLNMTLGMIIDPDDVIVIDYDKKEIRNETKDVGNKVPDIKQLFEGIKDSATGEYKNTLIERMELDANFEEIKEAVPEVKEQKKTAKKGEK